ncbi:MAG TPA: MlaD family protein [Rhizomicrobium sp.]|jgi:phospholipid/cholesterol/gamma-HCH transport system substrate-binding protein
METKANYAAVGAFVLACVIGIVIAILWLAGAQYSHEFETYRTYFTGSVTGLGDGTKVRYNGIDVGRVKAVDFDPDDPKRVIATLDINPEVHIHEDSLASIASEGLTGGTYVEIDGGSKDSPLVTRKPGERYAIINSRPSTIQQLVESAPQVVAKLNKIADSLNDVLNPQNRRAISDIFANLRDTTGVLQRHSADIDATLANLAVGTEKLNVSLDDLHKTLGHVDLVAVDANVAVGRIGKLADDSDKFVTGDGLAQFGQLVGDARRLVESLTRLTDKLNRQPTQLLFGDRRQGYTPK